MDNKSADDRRKWEAIQKAVTEAPTSETSMEGWVVTGVADSSMLRIFKANGCRSHGASENPELRERQRQMLEETRKQVAEMPPWSPDERRAAIAEIYAKHAERKERQREMVRTRERDRRWRKRLFELLAALPEMEQWEWLQDQRLQGRCT